MKKNNIGFTLIELLASIVIIAIISLIILPIITNIIEKTKKSTFKDSSLSIFSAAELYIMENKINETDENGIEISKLKLKNKNYFTSGIFYYENKKIRISFVSNGTYCATGELTNLKIEKKDCHNDNEPPIININKKSSDWVNNLNINISISDLSKIKEIKYKVVKSTENKNEINWIVSENSDINLSLTEPDKYKIYVYAKDSRDNEIEEEFGEYKIIYYDSFEVLADMIGLNINDYASPTEFISNGDVMNSIIGNTKSLDYMINSASDSRNNILNTIINNTAIMSNLINSKDALTLIGGNSFWLSSLKQSSNYVSTYVQKILDTKSITNEEKYKLKLPAYLYNKGLSGFAWTQFSGLNTYWCQNYDSACRVGITSTSNMLTLSDNSSTYYMGVGLTTDMINLGNYSKLKFYYSFAGNCYGDDGQRSQEFATIFFGNNQPWAYSYQNCNNTSGWVEIPISKYGEREIKLYTSAGGLSSYTINFSVSVMYLY